MRRPTKTGSQPTPTIFDKLTAGGSTAIGAVSAANTGRSSLDGTSAESAGLVPTVSQLERFNERALRMTVRRDLSWLLNTLRLGEVIDLSSWPNVNTSVLNYGIAEVAGRSSEQFRIKEREKDIRNCILTFEPRILPSSLKVTGEKNDDHRKGAAMEFRIEGDIAAAVEAMPVEYRTRIDLETGDAALSEKYR